MDILEKTLVALEEEQKFYRDVASQLEGLQKLFTARASRVGSGVKECEALLIRFGITRELPPVEEGKALVANGVASVLVS
jgi:hypothetical protein